ncbi:hypothetical protein [Nocardia stercoris]|uniref:hypothetical protein n=1 Tax=Nocardia stercoris TaxID=2483361 RepID=UPI0011C43727|nr:hypothetical protein [Nocardia stercoris]
MISITPVGWVGASNPPSDSARDAIFVPASSTETVPLRGSGITVSPWRSGMERYRIRLEAYFDYDITDEKAVRDEAIAMMNTVEELKSQLAQISVDDMSFPDVLKIGQVLKVASALDGAGNIDGATRLGQEVTLHVEKFVPAEEGAPAEAAAG